MRHLLKSAAAKGFLLTALLLFAASICRAQSAAPETPDYTLRSGGMERKIVEYAGEGVKTLSVPERATITNMGAELGATTSIFPSDEATKKFLEAQGRGDVWVPLSSDPDAEYDEEYTVDLSALEPLAAIDRKSVV